MECEQQIRKCERARSADLSSLLISEPEFISEINNPFVIHRCLDLLDELRGNIAQNGFTQSDLALLQQLYGNAGQSSLGDNLYAEYVAWSDTACASKAERSKEGYSSPKECKDTVLEAIDSEILRLEEHQKLEAARRAVPESAALDRLLRYDASLERIFDRTLSQLERLQRLRLSHPVSPSINLNVSSS